MEIRLPPDQEAHLVALAASAGRNPDEIVQEAVALCEKRQAQRQTQAETAARILELRKGNRATARRAGIRTGLPRRHRADACGGAIAEETMG
jgi:predicted transcriptional regulator